MRRRRRRRRSSSRPGRQRAPADVGGDIKLATFNVLNYFPTDRRRRRAGAGHTCTYFIDRAGNPITSQHLQPGNGPRGAARHRRLRCASRPRSSPRSTRWTPTSSRWRRSRTPQVRQGNRDDAIAAAGRRPERRRRLGTVGLRALAGRGRPAGRGRAGRDPHRLHLQAGQGRRWSATSQVLVGTRAVRQRARAAGPGVQADRRAGRATPSRSSSTTSSPRARGADDGTGQGNANPDRDRQASALVDFANDVQGRRAASSRCSWSATSTPTREEDPSRSSTTPGYDEPRVDDDPERGVLQLRRPAPGRSTTSSPTRRRGRLVTGADIWDINANESVAYQYSRYNYNVTDLFDGTVRSAPPTTTRRSSGINVPVASAHDRTSRSSAPTTSMAGSRTTRRRRGRCRGDGGCGQAAPCGRTRTRCSPRRVT